MSSRSSSIIPSAVSGSFGRRSRNRAAEGPSLTYAFACAVLPHKVHRFSKSDFRDTRILVGEGATSTVYKVLIQTPGREEAAAIKQKRLKGSWFDHDVSVESWLQTAYLDIRIMSHDSFRRTHNVVTALGYFWEPFEYTDGSPGLSPCLVLPLAMDEAPTLQHFFASLPKEGRAVGGALQFSLARDIANGLHELHSCGVVHGDLKPANILLFRETVDGPITAKLSDFSHSFIMSDYEGGKTKNLPRYTGTPPFVTPEVRRWEREMMATGNPSHLGESGLDMPNYYACDIFSLGDILRALATDGENLWRWLEGARHPDDVVHEFKEDDVLDHPSLYVGEIVAEVARFSFLTPHRAAAICECLEMCLQEDPEARGTALDVRNRLDEAEVEVGPSTLPRSQLAAMIQYIESSVDASPAARNLALSFLANLTADSDPSTVKEKP
ncbi:hypothetical protein NEMBOFW57_008522 [Staphylotrichum longicolle]|uniref:Protein kinase domain-containing protein n=1 Tax=Staphylotrichum longicolle TaxID=669026 RepID=A0AAD4HWQ1_9PEZI|nr:hypothetical protein NEMBOFW57_008522 [Staphylotrichum longicolle]